ARAGRGRTAESAAHGQHGQTPPPRPRQSQGLPRRRQLRRPVRASGRRRARHLERGGRRNARPSRRALGRVTTRTTRSLVWGAGAIGGTLGAYLVRAGHDVTFVDNVDDHVNAITRSGLRISGPIAEFTVNAPAFTPATLRGTWDTVLLA